MKKSEFSLDWFKKTIEKSVKKQVKKKVNQLMEQEREISPVSITPYRNIKLVNDMLTIVLRDGTILSKPNATEEDYLKAEKATHEEDLFTIVASYEVAYERKVIEKEQRKIEAILKGIELLKNNPDFIIDGNVVYLKGTERSMPDLLVEEFINVIHRCNEEGIDYSQDDEYNSLKYFFFWCCLNPRVEVAHELYRFLKENSFRITKQGFFVALRNVVTVEAAGDNELIQFVSNSYNKIKATWKKNPEKYHVFKDEDKGYYFSTTLDSENVENYVGNLKELYLELPNMKENRFTDNWTKTFDIRVGKVVSMPIEECNWSTQDCAAAGLHFTADQIHYVGCGDTSVLVLINPMKVVGIGQFKGRCYEYLPIMTVPRDEATRILHDNEFDTLQLDEEYAVRELEGLFEKAQEGFTAETKKYEFNLPQISAKEIRNIVHSLEEMKDKIDSRIITIN